MSRFVNQDLINAIVKEFAVTIHDDNKYSIIFKLISNGHFFSLVYDGSNDPVYPTIWICGADVSKKMLMSVKEFIDEWWELPIYVYV